MTRDFVHSSLRAAALRMFEGALKRVDAADAIHQQVHVHGSQLTIFDTTYDLSARGTPIFSVAIGKAALKMSAALDEILGDRLAGGIVAASGTHLSNATRLSSRWELFFGGHPLPNEESLAAARAAIELLRRADRSSAIIIFLISGGGSATFELPRGPKVTLEDLREANSVLISCGATIAEVNAVRLCFSAVKGGRLSSCAPHAEQISLIVSDTNRGEESKVASGPTYPAPYDAPDPRQTIARYRLEKSLPASILQAINSACEEKKINTDAIGGKHYLLLDNQTALEAAANIARAQGFEVEIASDIIEQPIQEGCIEMLARLQAKGERKGQPFCLISGGEFACPVRGDGRGGRNSETALRLALEMQRLRQAEPSDALSHTVALSAGTDGIDGNSPTAGAIADETTIDRALELGLDARSFLERSDAYNFFYALGDALVTGPTGTNVRDLRIMIRSTVKD